VKSLVRFDHRSNYHIEWELDGVTATMIDWFWSNMEKGFILWHPEEHEDFYWDISPATAGKFIGAVHVPPQQWANGDRRESFIRFDDPRSIPQEMEDCIVFNHVVIIAPISTSAKDYCRETSHAATPLVYRLHQWAPSDLGVKGMSSCFLEPAEKGEGWTKHCVQEIGNWEVFLPDIYKLYKTVNKPNINPFYPLNIEKLDDGFRYTDIRHYPSNRGV